MKVVIVCGHFISELGYVEVHLANALHRLGHTIKVITSNKASSSAKYLASSENEIKPNYQIVRLQSWFSYGQIVMARGIEKEIQNFSPNKVIVIGLGKVFPKDVFRIKNRKFELITLLGDNENTYAKTSKSFKRKLLQFALKTPVYKQAIKNSDRLVGYTPSTKEVVDSFINKGLKKELSLKYSTTSLGFDETEFNFDNTDGASLREEFGINKEEVVLITATRITPGKKIEKVIDAVDVLSKKGIRFKYVIIGFTDNEYCHQLKGYITDKGLNDVITTLPFISRSEMNKYYNMADIGLWSQAAISIFEGLATGLFMLLPEKKNVSHILSENNGVYYSELNLLNSLKKSILNYNIDLRAEFEKNAKSKFSFNIIAQNLVNN